MNDFTLIIKELYFVNNHNQMLNYHIIPAQFIQRPDAHFEHFLSLGSYQSPFQLEKLVSFSKISLYQHTKFPQYKSIENIQTLIIPLGQALKIDSKLTKNPVLNPQFIYGTQQEGDRKLTSFLFIKFIDQEGKISQNSNIIYQSKGIQISRCVYTQGHKIVEQGQSLLYVEKGLIRLDNQCYDKSSAIYLPKNCEKIECESLGNQTIIWKIALKNQSE